MTNVAIVEDDAEIRGVMQNYLHKQAGYSCTLTSESVESFLACVSEASLPDVVLMDIGLPGMSGIDGIRILKGRYPHIEIIMQTIYHDSHKIFDSLRAGASGYLLKNTPLPDIKQSIDMLMAGGAPMSPQIARKVIEFFSSQNTPHQASPLSDREKEIVVGLVDGLSYKMIADRMFISTETVRFHIKSVYRKLHVHSKADVIRKSLRGEI